MAVAGGWTLFSYHHDLTTKLMLLAAIPFGAVCVFTVHHEATQDAATLRHATWLILAFAAIMRLVLLPWPPVSTDIYRYIWDGRVQQAGINPYAYVPADPKLASIRDQSIFPNINRATYAPTIYPPAAQIVFRAVAFVGGGVTTMKLAIVGFEAASVAALLAMLNWRGLPTTRVLLYAWHPLTLFEFSGSGHIDAMAIAFALLACLAADRRSPGIAGSLLGIAVLAKFFPLVIAPALYRRWDWRAPVIGAVVVGALYLPFLSVGWRVFGYLSGYAHEESLVSGDGFLLLGLIDRQIDLPLWSVPAYLGGGAALLAAGAVWAILRKNPDRTGTAFALFLVGCFTVILSPHLPWYFTWVVPFICFMPLWSFLYLSCAAPLLYWQVQSPEIPVFSLLIYLPFFAILAIELFVRHTRQEQHLDVRLTGQ